MAILIMLILTVPIPITRIPVMSIAIIPVFVARIPVIPILVTMILIMKTLIPLFPDVPTILIVKYNSYL